jgi:hypothetical protein
MRDLADLTEKGALVREGERGHARYALGVPQRPVPHISLGTSSELVEKPAARIEKQYPSSAEAGDYSQPTTQPAECDVWRDCREL